MTMQSTSLALAAALSLAVSGAAAAATTHLMANLAGANEKPTAGDAKASGMAHVQVDTDKNQVCYELTTKDLAQPIMAHIHKGGADAAGPVAVALTPPDANGHSQGCASVDAAVAKDIAANPAGYYVNVHSATYKAGAIRGQLGK
ncbi:CHRD domain-containing protein [Phenylobacterium sp.]|uniref:CHRD domain-containing protein n=1 Tax=Phenylobacterium sp. TaxID=1871053 RepID=UPI0026159E17|nr:CHRD domain-containing protein [Phenylobacterium sp.]